MNSAPSSDVSETMQVHVLAVDDRTENLVALEALFKGTPYTLVVANSGDEALIKISEIDFAAIILDVQMPGLDGFMTAELIRKHERAKHTPIIFVTAINRNEGYERKGYISGAVDFLFKPIDTEILLAKVDVFADLYHSKIQIQKQAEIIHAQRLKDQEYCFMKKALESRDQFLSIASHELNTPITPLSLQMQSFLRMVRRGTLKSVEPERLERMLTIANGQVDRLARIIKELVDVTQISKDELSLVKEKNVSLLEVVESVLESFAEKIHQMGCEVKLDAHTDPKGFWDRMRIEQVIINLLSNALKYGLAKPILLIIEESDGKAIFKIRDQGIGIPIEAQERIFARFERAVSSRDFGGLGLGLFISKEIVDLHGGTLSVDSAPDQGSTFVVNIPLHADPE
jgi:signal transduction histidine kinase